MADVWGQYPVGPLLLDNHVITDATFAGADFIVADMGRGETPTKNFASRVQLAKDKGKPLIGYYAAEVEPYIRDYETMSPDRWKVGWEDPLMKRVICPQVFMGTDPRTATKRTIHAIIVALNQTQRPNGLTITDNWFFSVLGFIARQIWETTGIPVYISIDVATAEKLPHDGMSRLSTFLLEPNWGGVSTYLNLTSGAFQTASWNPMPHMDDVMGQVLKSKISTSGLGYAPRLLFICFSTGKYTFPGVNGVVPLFSYHGSRTELYETIAFVPTGSTVPTPPPGGTTTPTTPGTSTTTNADLVPLLQSILVELQKLNTKLENAPSFYKRFL